MFFGTESAWIEGFSQSAAERYGPWSTCIIFLRNGIEAILAYGVDLVVGGGTLLLFQSVLVSIGEVPGSSFTAMEENKSLPESEGLNSPTIWGSGDRDAVGAAGGGHSFWFNLQNHLLGCHLKVVEFTGCLLMPHKQNGTTWHLIDRC